MSSSGVILLSAGLCRHFNSRGSFWTTGKCGFSALKHALGHIDLSLSRKASTLTCCISGSRCNVHLDFSLIASIVANFQPSLLMSPEGH